MSEELKLCPFCGGKFGIVDVDGYMIIHTYDQDCPLYSAGGENGFIWRDEDALVSEFNRRPIEDALRTRITDLETENARLNKRSEYLEEQTRKACHLATTERADDLAQSYLAYWDDIHAERAELRDACKHALMFIVNGIACGRIELPDPALGDKANDTEGLLRSVLERYSLS